MWYTRITLVVYRY